MIKAFFLIIFLDHVDSFSNFFEVFCPKTLFTLVKNWAKTLFVAFSNIQLLVNPLAKIVYLLYTLPY